MGNKCFDIYYIFLRQLNIKVVTPDMSRREECDKVNEVNSDPQQFLFVEGTLNH